MNKENAYQEFWPYLRKMTLGKVKEKVSSGTNLQ